MAFWGLCSTHACWVSELITSCYKQFRSETRLSLGGMGAAVFGGAGEQGFLSEGASADSRLTVTELPIVMFGDD